MEVYMDDITIYGGTFEECLANHETVLHGCIEKNFAAQLGEMPFYGESRNCPRACCLQQGN